MTIIQLYLLSFLLFVAGCFAYRRSAPTAMHKSLFFGLSFLLLLLLIGYQIADYFTGNGIDDAVVFHLKYGLGGAGFSEYAGLIAGALLLIIVSVIIMAWLAFHPAQGRLKSRWVYLLLLLSLGFNPAVNDLDNIFNGSFTFRQSTNHQQPSEDADFLDYYRHADISGQQGNGKNIVFIYAESLERNYFDEDIFPGLIKGLRQLEQQSTYFTNIHQVYATTWTVAGMTASQCGVPLVMPSHGNSMSGMDTFMQSAVCIGDLLSGAGYYLAYMGGADLEFAGKGKLYKTHGFSEISGRTELQGRLADAEYMSSWGLYDDVMLDMVYQRFLELSAIDKPFGLFTLTLDTHHPEGHPTRSCEHIRYQDGSNKMLNSVACADYLLSNFIAKIMASPYADRTVVVLVSDHLSMGSKAYELLAQKPRKNLFMVIDSGQPTRQVDSTGSTLDIGATVLPFLGFSTDIGLGRNLLEQDESSQKQQIYIHTNASRWQQRISALWNFPKITGALTVDADNRQMHIDGRVFRVPALVELDENMETVIMFDFDRRVREQLTLLQHRLAIADDKSFLLIDACWNVRHFKRSLGEKGLCLVAGKGRKNLHFERLAGQRRYAVADIVRLVNPPQFAVKPIYQHSEASATAVFASLDIALTQGFEYLEVDFFLAADGKVNCLDHDSDNPAALNDKCTLASLAAWMQKNPAATIVADIETENFEDISAALLALPDAVSRVIPHIHNPYDFYDVRKNSYSRFIWVLDDGHGEAGVLDWVAQFDRAFAVAMPVANLDQALVGALKKQGIPVYAQALESPQQVRQLQEDFGISDIYTRAVQP